MKKIFALSFLALMSCPATLAAGLGSAGPSQGGGGGFAAPNAYGYAGSYTGGAGYGQNFGYNTMRPGNMPYVPYYGGYGGYNSPYGVGAFGAPVPYGAAGGGFYSMNYGGRNIRYWQSPNGYYYPWINGVAPTAYIPQSGQLPQATTPPISTVCSDMLAYLEQQKDKGNLSQDAFEHLKRRATDIRNKERDLRISGSGTVDSQDEAGMRRDLDGLGAEITKSLSD